MEQELGMVEGFLKKLSFWKTNKTDLTLGVFITQSSLCVYQAEQGKNLEKIQTVPCTDGDWHKAFSLIYSQFGAAQLEIVLANQFYQLVTADKPNVADDELTQALLWSVKDMVSEPVTNIHLDYFESKAVIGKVNVVVAPKNLLSQLAKACDDNAMTIKGISIEELAFSNLPLNDALAHLVVNHLPDKELLLTVLKDGELLMQRRVRGFTKLHLAQSEEIKMGIADNLSLEIQRSMDYFESQLRQAPVAAIELLMDGESQVLAQLLSANFNQKVTAVAHASMDIQLAKFALAEQLRRQA
jgi:MSHA biogenesis protein MshI